MGPVHKDADLSVVRLTEVKVGHAASEFDDTIFQCATLITV